MTQFNLKTLGQKTLTIGASLAFAFAAASVHANDSDRVQVSSLEVKSRIATMEQVNVTAEKEMDDTAPAASVTVENLLAELESLEAGTSQPPAEPVAQ